MTATAYIANVIGGEGCRIFDEPISVEHAKELAQASGSTHGAEVPIGDEGVVGLYGDEEGGTVHVLADDEDDAERRIIATFSDAVQIDDLQPCSCNWPEA